MERRNFIRKCGCATVGAAISASMLQSCGAVYYATSSLASNRITVARSEFIKIKKEKKTERKFVLIRSTAFQFPICLYNLGEDRFAASLLECTHKGCELNVGGAVFTCPCHGAEFSNTGKILTGPAEEDLRTFKTEIDNENIYITLA